MKQDTQSKFASILAAAQQKANNQATPKFSAADQPKKFDNLQDMKEAVNKGEVISLSNMAELVNKPDQPAPTQPATLSKMVSFTIIWHEGTGEFDGQIFTTWYTANKAMVKIYNSHEGLGYTKVKICVKWENGSEITDRADCSDSAGDFCAKRETIGQYLSRQNSVMYQSNLQVGDRVNLSFEDQYMDSQELQKATVPELLASPNFINDVASDIPDTQELSNLTIADILGDKPEQPETPQNTVKIIEYSTKAIAVIGETKPIKDVLKALGGRFNMYLTCGPGWIFPKTRYEAVKTSLSL